MSRRAPEPGERDTQLALWLDEDSLPLTHETWHDPRRRFFAALLDSPDAMDAHGEGGDTRPLLLLFNASAEDVAFPLPPGIWTLAFDTSREMSFVESEDAGSSGTSFACAARSVACLVLD